MSCAGIKLEDRWIGVVAALAGGTNAEVDLVGVSCIGDLLKGVPCAGVPRGVPLGVLRGVPLGVPASAEKPVHCVSIVSRVSTSSSPTVSGSSILVNAATLS